MKTAGRLALVTLFLLLLSPGVADATHAWGNYHWARQSNPFAVVLLDAVSPTWDSYLAQASTDWSKSAVLDTLIQPSSASPKSCKGVAGKVQVCSDRYGYRGWLGVAQIWVSGDHITKGTVKVNDSYFAAGSSYDTPGWRALVMCQEVGHTFGLDHQDENFDNANLGTCMDYTSDPEGPPSNLHPNQHDYDELAIIYAHLDGTTTVSSSVVAGGSGQGQSAWGRAIRTSAGARPSMFVRELRGDRAVFTFVIWAR